MRRPHRIATAFRFRCAAPSALLLVCVALLAGCMGGNVPTRAGRAPVTPDAMAKYLSQMKVNTAYVCSAATASCRRGEVFDERVKDQRGNTARVTVWMDPDEPYQLRIRTIRTIICPHCRGTGVRNLKKLSNIGINLACLHCEGDGELSGYQQEQRWILGRDDMTGGGGRGHDRVDPGTSPIPGQRDLRTRETNERLEDLDPDVPAEVAKHIEDLVSADPETRLRACEWLDANYIRKGVFFRRFMPMLRKAKWVEKSAKHELTVYRFWAGRKDIPEKAYYRVYVELKSGNIAWTEFEAAPVD